MFQNLIRTGNRPLSIHWDYGVRGSSQTFRIFPDGNILPK